MNRIPAPAPLPTEHWFGQGDFKQRIAKVLAGKNVAAVDRHLRKGALIEFAATSENGQPRSTARAT